MAAMIAHRGEAQAEQWLRGVKANLARKAAGGDRDVARDILGGICDIGMANAYYVGHMKNAAPRQRWAQMGRWHQGHSPDVCQTGGTHVNVSGAAVAKHAPHKDNAVKLLEYLVSEPAQALYARANYEYPVRANVAQDPGDGGAGATARSILCRLPRLPSTASRPASWSTKLALTSKHRPAHSTVCCCA